MGRAVITLVDNDEGSVDVTLDLFKGENNEEPGGDNDSTAHRLATYMMSAAQGINQGEDDAEIIEVD